MSSRPKVDETATQPGPPQDLLPDWLKRGGPPSASAPSGAASLSAVERSNQAAAAAAKSTAASVALELPSPTRAWLPSVHVELLFLDSDIVRRVRAQRRWTQLLVDLEDRPLDAEIEDFDVRASTSAVEDARAATEVMVRAEPELRTPDEVLHDGYRSDGRFLPPVGLFSGTLQLHYDDRKLLTCLVSLAAPFAGDDDLRVSVTEARSLLALGADEVPLGLLAGAAERVRRAFAKHRRQVNPSYVDEHAEQTLLSQRAFQRRSVLGDEHLRASLFSPGGTRRAVVYLPSRFATVLPLFRSLEVRLIAEVCPRADEAEEGSSCLRVGALGRLLRAPR